MLGALPKGKRTPALDDLHLDLSLARQQTYNTDMDWSVIETEVVIVAARSRGPGGQNVNKVSSASQLTWNLFSSGGLSGEEKAMVATKLANRINQYGEVYLRSDEYRDFPRNKTRCFEKLNELLAAALHKPKPRRATKPTKSARKKRLETKSKRSETKQQRQRVKY
jgi:ribosome-associated protein